MDSDQVEQDENDLDTCTKAEAEQETLYYFTHGVTSFILHTS